MADKSGASPQAQSVPASGGDIRGLGETFQPDLNSGVGQFAVPIELPPGVVNLQPALSFTYNTGAGNGPLGLGWNLGIPSITRRLAIGVPTYQPGEDAFVYGGSQLLEIAPGAYRAAIENGFERFTRLGEGWEVRERSGLRRLFGSSANSRIQFADGADIHVFAWLLDRVEDPLGNAITYSYTADAAQRYLERIDYAVYSVRCEYEPRPDVVSDFRSGYELRTARRCARITLHSAPVSEAAIRSWRLAYAEAALARTSLLASITLEGFDPESGETASLPPIVFTYAAFEPDARRLDRFSRASGSPPPNLAEANADLIDLDGRGLPGVLQMENGSRLYWSNTGDLQWTPRRIDQGPVDLSLQDTRVRFADMDGNGTADLLVGSGALTGYVENEGGGRWARFHPYRRSPQLDFEQRPIQLVDIDGDGKIDAVHGASTGLQLYRNNGPDGWSAPRRVVVDDLELAMVLQSLGDPRVRFADLNGDGLLDLVRVASGRVDYWPSRGHGRYGAKRTMAAPPRFPEPVDPARVFFTDVNGDGLSDVVYVGLRDVTCWINQAGERFSDPNFVRCTPPAPSAAAIRVADMTGSGTAGVLWTGSGVDYRYLSFAGRQKPGLLVRIDNGLGRVTTIEYGSSTDGVAHEEAAGATRALLPFAVNVVAAVVVEDKVTGMRRVTRYRYHDGHYDGRLREFDGFARTEEIDEGDEVMPTSMTIYRFHTEASARQITTDPELRAALKRKTYQIDVFGLDGASVQAVPFRTEEMRWAVRVESTALNGQRVLFAHVAETSATIFERTSTPRIERRLYTYDAAGNVLTEERRGEGGPAPLVLRTEATYASGSADGIVDRVARLVQRDAAGGILREVRRYYDGPAFDGLALGQVRKGLLTRVEQVVIRQADAAAAYGAHLPNPLTLGHGTGLDADGAAVWLVDVERYEHDAHGAITASRRARGGLKRFTLDDFSLFTIAITDEVGLVSKATPDYRVGKPIAIEDPNGNVTRMVYDALGRVTRVVAPGDTLGIPTVQYTYQFGTLPAARVTDQRLKSGAAPTIRTVEYVDGAGDVYQQRIQHTATDFVVSGQNVVSARGKTARRYSARFGVGAGFEPYIEDHTAPHHAFRYDALGRPVILTNPDGGESRVRFAPFEVVLADPSDNDPTLTESFATPRSEHYDAWNRLIGVDERSRTQTAATAYQLDPLDQVVRITDARGAMLDERTYDLLGRPILVRHIDAGVRLIIYNADGEIVEAVDAAGRTVSRTFDAVGRLLNVLHDGVVVEQHQYDAGAGANLAGRLARVEDGSGEVVFSYDARGAVIERTHIVPGQASPFTFRAAYDAAGRAISRTDPDGAIVTFDYGVGFLLRAIPGWVDQIDYLATGRRAAMSYANGVRTEWTFDAATERLAEIKTSRPASGVVFMHNRYSLDVSGNVRGIRDLRAAPVVDRTQSFEYDAFDQLVNAQGADARGVFTHTFTYDLTGNLVRNSAFSADALFYDAAGGNRLIGTDDGVTRRTLFAYDANGAVATAPDRTFAFDPRQLLTRVDRSDGVSVNLFYDFHGKLARKVVTRGAAQRTDLYFGKDYELLDGQAVRWVHVGDLLVAREQAGVRAYLHPDHLRSPAVKTDPAGNLLRETGYYPFGGVAFGSAASDAARFTGQRLDDDVGLYYFGARWYSSALGRFVSPDPLYLLHPEEGARTPRYLNPYAYAANNPVRFVDRSGLAFWDVVKTIGGVAALVVGGLALGLMGGLTAALGTAAIGAFVGAVNGSSTSMKNFWGGAAKGALIGFMAGGNFALGSFFFGSTVGGALGVINFLAIFPDVSKDDTYKGVLGWSSYLMPMSWPGHAIGLAIFTLNVGLYLAAVAVRGYSKTGPWKLTNIRIDWEKGVIHTEGGPLSRLNTTQGSPAFSYGNFVWFSQNQFKETTLAHEEGHGLNNAAFGWFQAYNVLAFDEDRNGSGAFFERLAESNAQYAPGGGRMDAVVRTPLEMWGSGVTL
jgi:RHS repeat-associated protein